MKNLIEIFSLDNEAFRVFAFWSSILVIKMLSMSYLTGIQRFYHKIYLNPEDAQFNNGKVDFNFEPIERTRRAHLNDLENCLPLLIIELIYLTTNPSTNLASNLFRIGGISRIFYTLSYLCGRGWIRYFSFHICCFIIFYMCFAIFVAI